jgi:hypothetical protein
MERQNFEQNLRDAFSNAGLTPSDQVWDGIELDLMKAERKKMKNRIFFYKTLAAASVLFGLALAGAGLYFFNEVQTGREIALNATSPNVNDHTNSTSTETGKIQNDSEIKASGETQAESSVKVSGKTFAESDKRNAQTTADVVDANAINRERSESLANSAVSETSNKRNENAKTKSSGKPLQRSANTLANSNENSLANREIQKQESNILNGYQNSIVKNSNESQTPVDNQLNPQTGIAGVDDNIGNVIQNNLPAEPYESLAMKVRRPQLAYLPPVKMNIPEPPKPDAVALMLARLNDIEKTEQQKEKKDKSAKENLWTSVGFTAGAISGGSATVTNKNTAMSTLVANTTNDIADKEANASGTSYSVGVNLGARVAKKWVLQGGLNYMTTSSDYTVDNAIGTPDLKTFSPASINGFGEIKGGDTKADAKVVSTAPYSVNNNVQYLSVPVQAGYLVLNRKFGIQLNAGVATDMFLKNQKTADADNLQKIDQGIDDDSPYKPVNFSGLMGAEFSYKVGQRYRLALNPGMRYPFSSIYKSEVGVKATPLTYDVGLRFRYIFQ